MVISSLSALALFFPKDYYYPFIKSYTIFSHLFFLFGVVGKAFFIMASVYALTFLSDKENSTFDLVKSNIIRGYTFWTMSLFSGEIWSYLGWGTPVVWDDASFTTVMAIWFYYAAFLHLHLLRFFNRKRRAIFALTGLPILIFIIFYTEMGKFCFPVI
jgi:hypothetical protein